MRIETRTTVLLMALVLVIAAFAIPTTMAKKPGAMMANGGGKIVNLTNASHFDFNVKNVSAVVKGHLDYKDPANALRVDSINVTTLMVTGNMATFSGFATINGTGANPFTVTVWDNSKNGKADRFKIEIGPYMRNETLKAGNIHVNS